MPTAVPTPGDPSHAHAEGGTRTAVIDLLLTEGPSTAAALAERLGLTVAGVRRHLDVLQEEEAVTSREQLGTQRRRGRPAREYLLTDKGRDRLPHGYDTLAADLLDYLAAQHGPEAVTAFARQRAEGMIASREAELAAAEPAQRLSLLADALTDAGYSASVEPLGAGEQLCQHHCPVSHVAARFPQLCEEEMAVFTQRLGTYAQRLATIARGDSFCTTFVPTVKHRSSDCTAASTPDTPTAPGSIRSAPSGVGAGKDHR